jgi:hypothetical protein
VLLDLELGQVVEIAPDVDSERILAADALSVSRPAAALARARHRVSRRPCVTTSSTARAYARSLDAKAPRLDRPDREDPGAAAHSGEHPSDLRGPVQAAANSSSAAFSVFRALSWDYKTNGAGVLERPPEEVPGVLAGRLQVLTNDGKCSSPRLRPPKRRSRPRCASARSASTST